MDRRAFLGCLGLVAALLAAGTQLAALSPTGRRVHSNQALSALLFLYKDVLETDPGPRYQLISAARD